MNFKNEFVLWGERHFLISQISERCVLSHTYTHLEKGNTYSYLCFINAHCFAFGKTTNHLIARLCLAGNFNHFHTLLDLFCVCVCVCVFIQQKAWGPHRTIIKLCTLSRSLNIILKYTSAYEYTCMNINDLHRHPSEMILT